MIIWFDSRAIIVFSFIVYFLFLWERLRLVLNPAKLPKSLIFGGMEFHFPTALTEKAEKSILACKEIWKLFIKTTFLFNLMILHSVSSLKVLSSKLIHSNSYYSIQICFFNEIQKSLIQIQFPVTHISSHYFQIPFIEEIEHWAEHKRQQQSYILKCSFLLKVSSN